MIHSDSSPQTAVWTETGRDDSAADVSLTSPEPGAVRVEIEAPNAAITCVALRWPTRFPFPARILGDHWERGYGDLEWRGTVPERMLPWYAILCNDLTGELAGVGVETGAASLASWRVDESGVTLVLDVRCGGRGVRLGGRRLAAATVRVLRSDEDESAYAFARRFCQALCRAPRLPARPVYGGNDWYFRYGNITAEAVREDAALIRSLAPDGPNLPFFVIDAGWFGASGCNGGPYDRGNAGFPDMPGLAESLRCTGVRPGIWIRPLLTTAYVPDSWKLPPEHPLAGHSDTYLDPSVPEVRELVRADIRRLAGWGFELIKHDFTTYDIAGRWGFEMGTSFTRDGWRFADAGRTTAEIIRDLYADIRSAAGEDICLIGCNTVGHLGAGLFELQRTGDDTSGKHWERTRKMGINTLAFRMPQHGTFFAVDADCVGLTNAIPWEQNRQWLDLLARSGTPLFVSADPAAVGPTQRAALQAAFAAAAEPAKPGEPLDWLETTCPRRWRLHGQDVKYDWAEFPGAANSCPG